MPIFNRQTNHFSLVFSQEKVQILKLNQSGNKVLGFAEAPLPPGVIQNGIVIHPQQLAKIILQVKEAAKIRSNQAAIGIPETKSFTKIITLPYLKGAELDEAVRWEAESFLPSPVKQLYLDYKIISQENREKITVLLVAVPKKLIDSYLKTLSLAKIKALDFETTSLSLSRLLEANPHLNLIAEVKKESSILTITQGKSIKASSILNFNQKEDQVNDLINTLNQMTEYYEEKFGQDQKITAIYLCGDLASDSLKKSIETGTKKPTALLKLNLANFPPQKIISYLVPISLAQKEIRFPQSPQTINLIPPQLELAYLKKERQQFFTQVLSLTFISFLLLALINWGFCYYFHAVLNSQKQAYEQAQSAQTAETAQINQQVRHLNKQTQAIIGLSQRRNFPQPILAKLLSSFPDTIKITSLTLNPSENSIALSGVAKTRPDLLQLKSQLEKEAAFTQVKIPLSSFQSQEDLNFTLSLIIVNDKT